VKYNERITLGDGTVCQAVNRVQPGQVHGYWVYGPSADCTDCEIDLQLERRSDMWRLDEAGGVDQLEFEDGYWALLCPVDEMDPPPDRTAPLAQQAAALANPKQAYGDKKVPMHLVPPALVIGAARALGEGAKKYGAYNWRNSKVEALTYVGAIQRHLAAYQDGEDVDPESTTGKLHLEGIAACCAILMDALHGGFLIDNRPPAGPAPRLVLTPK
jgi:hypothetical protein